MKVTELKALDFSSLTSEQQIQIKNHGRPTPQLDIKQVSKSNNRDFKREFNVSTYERLPWICGCETTNRLFCFPCLLFAKRAGEYHWVEYGVNDLSHLSQKINKHTSSHSHLTSMLEFNLVGKAYIHQQLSDTYKQDCKKLKEQAARNRRELSRLIDAIKVCEVFDLALRGHDSSNSAPYRGNIDFSTELYAALKDDLDRLTVFEEDPNNILEDLLDCMLTECQNYIKKEMAGTTYISVTVEDVSDILPFFEIAIAFRYLASNRQPVEQFWELSSPSAVTAGSISECIQKALAKAIDDPKKLVSLSFDGYSPGCYVPPFLQRTYKNAHFIHDYAHNLTSIIAQCTSKNQEIRVFFSSLGEIASFFSDYSQGIVILDDISGKKSAGNSTIRWNFENKIVETVFENTETIIKCMERIEAVSKQSILLNQASAIRRMLTDTRFIFWLAVFNEIMPHVNKLERQIRSKNADTSLVQESVEMFITEMEEERENMDTVIGNGQVKIEESSGENPEGSLKRRKVDDFLTNGSAMAKEACGMIINQISRRFAFAAHYSAVALLDSEKFRSYDECFPSQLIEDTMGMYTFLDKNRLKTELEVIYKRLEFRNISGALCILQFLTKNNMHETFFEVYTLALVIATIPMMPTDEASSSMSQKVKTFLRNSAFQKKLSALAMLSIEKKMISNIPYFNEKVINLFASTKDSRKDLL